MILLYMQWNPAFRPPHYYNYIIIDGFYLAFPESLVYVTTSLILTGSLVQH